MAQGKRDGFSYLDGIPVKVTEKCRPPRKVLLPVSCHFPNLASLFKDQYDLTLENQVIKCTEHYLEQLKASESAKIEKVASEIENFTKSESSCELNSTVSKESVTSNTVCDREINNDNTISDRHSIPKWQLHSILQPQQVPCQSVDNGLESRRSKNINISDFENESSPFDYMELQTINDLEELNNVFQDMNVTKSHMNHTSNNIEHNVPINAYLNLDLSYQSNGETQNRLPLGHLRTVIKRTLSQPNVEVMNSPNKNGHEMEFVSSSVTNTNHVKQKISSYSGATEYSNFNSNLSSNPLIEDDTQTNLTNSDNKDTHFPLHSTSASGMRISRSIPDLRKPSDASSAEEHYVWFANTSSPSPKSTDNMGKEQTSLSDCYDELSSENQVLVNSIREMGFPGCQVAQAVKHFGSDMKKVIDHLCHMQQLTESGYDDREADMALHLNGYDVEEAKKFLDLTSQLMNLGFEKNVITKALIQHKNDRDKALDTLLS